MAVSSSTKKVAAQPIEMDMTPMIDVTFLLLIFFLCTLNLQPLEGLLQSNLPKNVGVFSSPSQQEPIEPIKIILRRIEPPTGEYEPQEIMLLCDSSRLVGPDKFDELYRYLRKVASSADKVPVLIITDQSEPLTARYGIPHGEIISTLDVCHSINNDKKMKDKLEIKFHISEIPTTD